MDNDRLYNKFGNTSRTIVSVPHSFLTNNLKPIGMYNTTHSNKYFKESDLFKNSTLMNVNNNSIKESRKYDNYNKQKYIALHKRSCVELPENPYNFHFQNLKNKDINKFNYSQVKKNINEIKDEFKKENDINDNNLSKNYINIDLFKNIKTLINEDEDNTKQMQLQLKSYYSSSVDFTKYKMHNKERYNKDYKKYQLKKPLEYNSKSTNKYNKSKFNNILNYTNPIIKKTTNNELEDNLLQEINKSLSNNEDNDTTNNKKYINKFDYANEKTSNINKLSNNKNNKKDNENTYIQGYNDYKNKFRIKIDTLLDRIGSNYNTNKWSNSEEFFILNNKLNDTMYTPITQYNNKTDSETVQFKNTLLKKIENLPISDDRKREILKQFKKTTLYIKPEGSIENITDTCLDKNINNKTFYDYNNLNLNFLSSSKINKEFNITSDNIKSNEHITLPNINTNYYNILPNIKENNIEYYKGLDKLNKINNDYSYLYERYKPSKLFSGFPSPTFGEFNYKKGECFGTKRKEYKIDCIKEKYKMELKNSINDNNIISKKSKYNNTANSILKLNSKSKEDIVDYLFYNKQ